MLRKMMAIILALKVTDEVDIEFDHRLVSDQHFLARVERVCKAFQGGKGI